MNISLSAFVPENLVSRDRFGSPSRVSLLISILRLNLVLTYGIPPEFRGGVLYRSDESLSFSLFYFILFYFYEYRIFSLLFQYLFFPFSDVTKSPLGKRVLVLSLRFCFVRNSTPKKFCDLFVTLPHEHGAFFSNCAPVLPFIILLRNSGPVMI